MKSNPANLSPPPPEMCVYSNNNQSSSVKIPPPFEPMGGFLSGHRVYQKCRFPLRNNGRSCCIYRYDVHKVVCRLVIWAYICIGVLVHITLKLSNEKPRRSRRISGASYWSRAYLTKVIYSSNFLKDIIVFYLTDIFMYKYPAKQSAGIFICKILMLCWYSNDLAPSNSGEKLSTLETFEISQGSLNSTVNSTLLREEFSWKFSKISPWLIWAGGIANTP